MAGETPSGSSRIFISYRRGDAQWPVEAIYQKLQLHFGDRIFRDVDNIALGQDFTKVINNELQSCAVLLAVIGSRWLTAEDPKTKNRRLSDPGDTLRLEIATALRNDDVLVIPVLVDGASMPGTEDLPSDLERLARRNGVEVGSGARFDADVNRLIKAIEKKAGLGVAPKRAPVAAEPKTEEVGATEELDLFEIRRRREIAEHVRAATQAFDAGDYESVIEAAERALFRDPNAADARTLIRKARTALDEQKIGKWLVRAQEILKREPLADGDVAAASDLIDQALSLIPTHEAAGKLRQEILQLRKRRERQRDLDRQVQTIVARAQSSFDEEDYEAAIQYCEDALSLPIESPAARDLRAKAAAAKEEQRREREVRRRAQQVVKDARDEFAAGNHAAALALLEQFSPPHDLVERVLEELRDAMDARALAEVAAARRDFASGQRDAAIARLEAFLPPHAAVARALTDLRVELEQLKEEEARRNQEEEARRLAEQRRQQEEQRRAEEEARQRAEAEAAAERRRAEVGGKIAESAARLANREVEPALVTARAALALDPSNADAKRAVERAEQAVALQKDVAAGLRDVRSLIKAARYAAALETLDKLSTLDPHAEGLGTLREEAEAGQRAERLCHEIDEQLAAARRALAAGNLQAALETTRAALGRDATHAGAVALERELNAAIQAEETARIETLEAQRRNDEAARAAKEKADREAREARAREEAKSKEEKEAAARKAKEKAEQEAREAKTREAKEKAEREAREAREDARRKEEAEAAARKAKEKAEHEAREAKAREDARRKEEAEAAARKAKEKAEQEAREAKERAEREVREAKAREEKRKQEEAARKAKEKAEREAREAKAREDARRKEEETARKAKEREPVAEVEPVPLLAEPEPKKLPIAAIAGGVGAVAAAILLVVWMRSGSTEPPPSTPAAATSKPAESSPAPNNANPTPSQPGNASAAAETKAPAAADAPKATPPNEPAAPAPRTPPPADPRVAELQQFRAAARDQWQRGNALATAASLASAMKLAPGNPETWELALDLMRQSREKMQETRKAATDAKAESTKAYRDGEKRAAEGDSAASGPGVRGGPRGRPVEALRSYSAAIELFKKAASEAAAAAAAAPVATPAPPPTTTVTPPSPPTESKPPAAQPKSEPPPSTAKPNEPVNPPSTSPLKPPPSGAGSSAPGVSPAPSTTPPSAPSAASAPSPWIAEQAQIQKVLHDYESAYAALDVDAVRRVLVLPDASAKQLRDSFNKYKSYSVTVKIESITPQPDQRHAIVKAKIRRTFQEKGGTGHADTGDQSQTLNMEKTAAGWVIASIR